MNFAYADKQIISLWSNNGSFETPQNCQF